MDINNRRIIGWTTIIIICLIPAFLWFAFGAGINEFSADLAHSLGELFGLIGMTMFAMTFVLSTRIGFIEDIFGGLDRVYIAHAILGGGALILILFHPIFLVLKFVPSQISLAAKYLLPSSYWSVNFGIIALAGLIILIFVTLFSRIKYNKWKFSHEFLGVVFIIAVLHIFLVRGSVSSDNIFAGYFVYAAAVSILGMGAFSYSLFFKNRFLKNAVYKIDKINQSKDTFEIILSPEHKPISYKSGQFVFLRFFNENISSEAHPFSIASKSDEYRLRVIVKKLGDYTSEIGHLKEGDKVSVEGPYGRFSFYCPPNKDQIWIAAGIGITPFIGMAEDLEGCKINKKIDLFYTSKEEFIGENIFSSMQEKYKGFRFIPWDSNTKGRISAADIKKTSGNLKDREILICGPSGFKESIIKGLIEEGIKEKNIHEEAFEFR